jgi:hypothetical protein
MKEGPLGINYTLGFGLVKYWWNGVILLNDFYS